MKKHKFDPIAFVIGVVITGLGVTFATGVDGTASIIPATIGGFGLILVTAATTRIMSEKVSGD